MKNENKFPHLIPGYDNSNEDHWQTYFENQLPNCHRIQQKEVGTNRCVTIG
ncbi:MAG: alpha/beta hydrolase [Cytophagaceae bacterium]|nr:alpha/beta hydrolase [Cytophagaceae bacterium]